MKKFFTSVLVLSLAANAYFFLSSNRSPLPTVQEDVAAIQRDFPGTQTATFEGTVSETECNNGISTFKNLVSISATDNRHYAVLSPSLVMQMLGDNSYNAKTVIAIYPTMMLVPPSKHESLGMVCRAGSLNADGSITFTTGNFRTPAWCPEMCPSAGGK